MFPADVAGRTNDAFHAHHERAILRIGVLAVLQQSADNDVLTAWQYTSGHILWCVQLPRTPVDSFREADKKTQDLLRYGCVRVDEIVVSSVSLAENQDMACLSGYHAFPGVKYLP